MLKSSPQKSLWPAWFPYPSSWLRAVALAVWMAIVLRVTLFWGGVFGMTLYRVTENIESSLWCLGLALLTAFFVFALMHHLLFSQPSKWRPSWFPGRKSLWQGFYAPIVMGLAIGAGILFVLPFHRDDSSTMVVEARWFGSIWLVAAAYLYQLEYLVRKAWRRKPHRAQ